MADSASSSFSFSSQHASMLLKYSGISFISGAVNHGFFSGERSLWTAGIGIVLFVMGAWWEHHLTSQEAETPKTLLQTLLWGTLLSIGLGFFTGGLQHFPDSPARSAWVVPAGFFISVLAMAVSGDFAWQRKAWLYVVGIGLATGITSYSAWQWFEANPAMQQQHSHGDDSHSVNEQPALVAQTISRSVIVRMDDRMRFTPSSIPVQAGETIHFVVHNDGATAHEMVLGSAKEIAEHAELMRQIAAGKVRADSHDHHAGGASLHVDAGKKGEMVVTFAQATTLEMACLIPGHLEAGMRGTIEVGTQPVVASSPVKPAPAAHDHSTHKH